MKNYTKSLFFLGMSMILVLALFTGCGKNATANTSTTRDISYGGVTYTIPEQPKRIAVLSNSILSMIYALDGTAIARPVSTEPLPEDQEKVPPIGHTGNINMEQLLSLQPDLVLGIATQHKKLADQLTSNHIPHMILSYDGIDDNIPLLTLLGEVLHKERKAEDVISTYKRQIEAVKQSIVNEPPVTVAVLRATGKSITAETKYAVGASLVQELGMNNVTANRINQTNSNAKTVPYSLENLTLDNPQVIFIVTMGEKSDVTAQMEKSMISNPAWKELQAVKNNKVFYLPSNLFLLNPGLQVPQAMAQLVEDAYGIHVDIPK